MIRPRKGGLAVALIASQLVLSGALAADKCIKTAEVEADKVRYIETQLKVAKLQCYDNEHAELSLLYNAFILEKRPYLVRSQKPLLTYLQRTEKKSVASYIADIADRVSVESTNVSQFCTRAMLAAEFSAKAGHPVKILGLMPIAYKRPAALCKEMG